MVKLIESTVTRYEVLGHLDGCAPCAALFAFARDHQDLGALDAWCQQLAAHLAADRERRDFDRDVLARLGAYRRARRETEVA